MATYSYGILALSGDKTNPGMAFASDVDTGFYLIGAANIGVSCGDSKIVDIAATGASITGTLAVSGITTLSDDVKITAAKKLFFDGGGDTYWYEVVGNTLRAIVGNSTSITLEATGVTVAGNFIASGVGPHAIGGATLDYTQLVIRGAFSSAGAATLAASLKVMSTLEGHSGDSGYVAQLAVDGGTIEINGNSAVVAAGYFSEPIITETTGNAAIAATVYIKDAPTEGTVNHALMVATGTTNLAGAVTMGSTLGITGVTTHTTDVVCATGALATAATSGFLYIPTSAGVPSGTPSGHTGTIALIFDTTNDDLYVYDGGWIKVAMA